MSKGKVNNYLLCNAGTTAKGNRWEAAHSSPDAKKREDRIHPSKETCSRKKNLRISKGWEGKIPTFLPCFKRTIILE